MDALPRYGMHQAILSLGPFPYGHHGSLALGYSSYIPTDRPGEYPTQLRLDPEVA